MCRNCGVQTVVFSTIFSLLSRTIRLSTCVDASDIADRAGAWAVRPSRLGLGGGSRLTWVLFLKALFSSLQFSEELKAQYSGAPLGLGGGSRLTGVLVLARAEFRDLLSTAKHDSILKSVAQSG